MLSELFIQSLLKGFRELLEPKTSEIQLPSPRREGEFGGSVLQGFSCLLVALLESHKSQVDCNQEIPRIGILYSKKFLIGLKIRELPASQLYYHSSA